MDVPTVFRFTSLSGAMWHGAVFNEPSNPARASNAFLMRRASLLSAATHARNPARQINARTFKRETRQVQTTGRRSGRPAGPECPPRVYLERAQAAGGD